MEEDNMKLHSLKIEDESDEEEEPTGVLGIYSPTIKLEEETPMDHYNRERKS